MGEQQAKLATSLEYQIPPGVSSGPADEHKGHSSNAQGLRKVPNQSILT
jgi:hypothetical protein